MTLSENTADDVAKEEGQNGKAQPSLTEKECSEAAGFKLGAVPEKDWPALLMKLGLSLTRYRMQKEKFFRRIGVRFKRRERKTTAKRGDVRRNPTGDEES